MITNITCYPIYPDKFKIEWDIYYVDVLGDFLFDVSILGGDKQTVVYKFPILINKYSIIANQELLSYHEEQYVRIICTPPEINKNRKLIVTERIEPVAHELSWYEFGVANEIVRKETLYFERKVGRRCYIIKKKIRGQPCSNCVDPRTGTLLTSSCNVCYGSKYGFYEPVLTWADFVDQPIEKLITDIGTTEEKKSQIRLTNLVLASKHDIIYDHITKVVYEASQEPQIVRYRSYPIGQIVACHAKSPKDILYKMVVQNDY